MTSSEADRAQVPWRPEPALLPAGDDAPFVPWPLDRQPARGFSPREILPELSLPSPFAGKPGTGSEPGTEDGVDLLQHTLIEPRESGSDDQAGAMHTLHGEALERRLEEERQAAWSEGHAQGVREGQRRAEVELARRESSSGAARAAAAERQAALQQEILHALHELRGDARRLHAPLGRLALHLAEQLLRGELRSGGQAVARLVDNALQALGPHPLHVTVRLHPEDLAALGPLTQTLAETVTLEPAAHLRRGSVEAMSDGTLVQDWVENRLNALAAQLLQSQATGAEDAAASS